MTEVYADRYLRFMLQNVLDAVLKRWIMWSAVALRSRWVANAWKRTLLIIWLLAAVVDMTTFVLAARGGDVARMAVAAAVPAISALFRGEPYGAGLSPPSPSPRYGYCHRPCW